MKTIVLAACLSLFSFGSHSQIEGGTFLVGGSLMFNHHRPASSDTLSSASTLFTVNPQIGMAFADNFVAGAWLQFSSFTNTSSWGVGPFVRYYMNNFFVQLGYGYTRTGDTGNSLVDVELGYAIFLNDNVALEPAAYYNQYFNGRGMDLGAKIGLQVYLNR